MKDLFRHLEQLLGEQQQQHQAHEKASAKALAELQAATQDLDHRVRGRETPETPRKRAREMATKR